MNKVIVVGHPQSGLEFVGGLLERCGMQSALPSKRDNINATEITKTLCKAHGVNLLSGFVEEIKQLKVAPIWQSIVLDLMLANYDQPLWGWSDTNAVHLLEYFKEQDESFLFVLVYHSPEDIFYKQSSCIGENEFQCLKDEWINYNSTLLNFYTKNRERCILFNFEGLGQNVDKCIQLINEKIGLDNTYLNEDKVVNINDIINFDKNGIGDGGRRTKVSIRRQKKALAEMIKNNEGSEVFLLKNTDETFGDLNLCKDVFSNIKYSLAKKMILQDVNVCSLFERLQEIADVSSNENINNDESILFLNILNHIINSDLMIKDLKEGNKRLSDLFLKEKDQLIIQVHSLEKTLESNLKYLSDIKKQKDEIERLAIWRANHIKELNQIKNDLEKKKDELERQKIEVEKVATWRANHIKELNQIKNDLEKKKDEMERQKIEVEKVATWRANHIKELNQIKEELYKKVKLGEAKDLGGEKELLLSQIYMLQEEVEEYFIQNKQLQLILEGRGIDFIKDAVISNYKVPLTGAVERVKQDKSYRLGAKLIENSKTVKGLIQLPLILYREASISENLPPLDEYEDAYKAEKIKNHLSYRFGKILNDIIDEPVSIFKSPINLYKEIKVFNENKKKR